MASERAKRPAGDPLRDAYRADTAVLVARRVTIVVLLLTAGIASATTVDWLHRPEHGTYLLLADAAYALAAIGLLALVGRRPALSVRATQGMLMYAAVGLAVYSGLVHNRSEVLVVTLVLLVCGAAVLVPWTGRDQLWGGIGMLLAYPLGLMVGVVPGLPITYEVVGLLIALTVATLGAYGLDGYRWLSFQQMEETRGANRLKSEFVATVAHELRTPLGIILGYAEVLLDGFAPGTEQYDMLQRMAEQARGVTQLIQALLDVQRLEERRLPITRSAFTIGELMADLRGNLPPSWHHDGVVLRWEVPDAHIEIQSDRGKLEMILRNLLHNVLKYTHAGSVTVSCQARLNEGRVLFAVADTGPGIAPAEQALIFEMFRQGGGRAPGQGGVGLGLYIVKRLTEALGGQVSVDSCAGAGACFTVCLPLQAEGA